MFMIFVIAMNDLHSVTKFAVGLPILASLEVHI